MRSWWRSVGVRLRGLLNRHKLEQDFEDEVAFHLAMKAEKMNDTDAARRRFGNELRIREEIRDQWTFQWLESVWLDVRHAARAVARTPGFAAIAVLSLAIGIGANTAIFTVLHELFLKSLPVKEPDRLRVLTWTGDRTPARYRSGYTMNIDGRRVSSSFSAEAFEEITARATAFEALGGFTGADSNAVIRGQALSLQGQFVTSGYFQALGAQPQLGRTFVESDVRPDAPVVAVISWALYQRAFGGDASALGSTITINREATTVVGILPPALIGFTRASPIDVYLPLVRRGQLAADKMRWIPQRWWIQMIGRLRPGATDAEAREQVNAALESVTVAMNELLRPAEKFQSPKIVLQPGRSGLTFLNQQNRRFLLTLFGMVGVVLLIACANVTNLLLARGSVRAREIAVRQSLGAGRGRIIRHLLTETALIAFVGGLLGFGLAQVGTVMLTAVVVGNPEANVVVRPDSTVLAFTLALTMITALATGFVPALRASSVQPVGNLRQAGTGASSLRQRLARGLVAVQVGLAVVLVAGAGMFGRTLVNLNSIDIGFKPDNLLLFEVDGRRNGYEGEKLAGLYERIYEKVTALPGVHAVTHSTHALLSYNMSARPVAIPGRVENPVVSMHEVGDRFLTIMGTPILLGRDLDATDHAKAPRAAVINTTMARDLFDGNALGREFALTNEPDVPIRVVGIAADTKYDRLTSETPPTLYLPWRQHPQKLGRVNFEMRTSGDPLSLASAVRQAVAEVDRTLPVSAIRTQREQIDRVIARERTFAMLGAFFSSVAVLLACIGIYGVLAYAVARRTGEFGVRLALGATPRAIVWLVVSGIVAPVVMALAIGVPASVAASRLIEASLYGVKPGDPVTLAGAVVAILAAALLAALVPSRRAAKCDPAVALRYE